MLYYIQYYNLSEKYNPIQYQMSTNIVIKFWQQVDELSIGTMIDNYKFPHETNGYEPCFVFIKYETDQEKKQLEGIFSDDLVDVKQFKLSTRDYATCNNILVVQCY